MPSGVNSAKAVPSLGSRRRQPKSRRDLLPPAPHSSAKMAGGAGGMGVGRVLGGEGPKRFAMKGPFNVSAVITAVQAEELKRV